MLSTDQIFENTANCPEHTRLNTKDNDPIPLCLIVNKMNETMAKYRLESAKAKPAFPLISKAEFSFKTVKTTKVGLAISFLIFSFGATRQVEATDEVIFGYFEPKPVLLEEGTTAEFGHKKPPHDFSQELLSLLLQAASQIATAQTFGELDFATLTLNLSYGVTWDFTAEAKIPISFVTIDPSLDHKKSDVQTVKFTFGHEPKAKP